MKYLAITQKTCDWLLRNKDTMEAVRNELPMLAHTDGLKEGVLIIGALYACMHNNVLAFWNSDYSSSSGVEDWGFILLKGETGLLSASQELFPLVFERELFVINLRLQGLLLPDDRFIHRAIGQGIHSCLSGRGSTARHFSIGYKEGVYQINSYESKSVLCVGPWGGTQEMLATKVSEHITHMPDLIFTASKLLTAASKRPVIDSRAFIGMRQKFLSETTLRKESAIESPITSVPQLQRGEFSEQMSYQTLGWSYDDWFKPDSSLTPPQREILESDILLRQPLRIVGAAGSGKSLLMQLLCMKQLRAAMESDTETRILYVVHNNEMADTITDRFKTLGASKFIGNNTKQQLDIRTLFGYAQQRLNLPHTDIINQDAYQTKLYQREVIIDCINKVSSDRTDLLSKSKFIEQLADRESNRFVYAEIISVEIGVAIKGRDLTHDKRKYITVEKPLSRFHGVLNPVEREFVYEVFMCYHHLVFDEFQVLDSDDVALTLLGHLRTPLWEMRRRKEGYNYVFVDETQLFNENERQLFHLLTKGEHDYIPIALALDEAQSLNGAISAGFATLGIENISNQTLYAVHRCTKDILKLAFYVIQRTTDLFTNEFPDFTEKTVAIVPDHHHLSEKPKLIVQSQESEKFAKAILREVRQMRKQDIRQIALVVHAEKYWGEIVSFFKSNSVDLPVVIHSVRGERIDPKQPLVVITRPEYVGGQEYDGIIAIGIEKGLVPPTVKNHSGLETALEQQSFRELYLSFTRARYRLVIFNSKNSLPSSIIADAVKMKLIDYPSEIVRDN